MLTGGHTQEYPLETACLIHVGHIDPDKEGLGPFGFSAIPRAGEVIMVPLYEGEIPKRVRVEEVVHYAKEAVGIAGVALIVSLICAES
jgi:hypothetical protein